MSNPIFSSLLLTLLLAFSLPSTSSNPTNPTPTPWPHQFHSTLFMNRSGTLQMVDLWYDWPNGRNFNIIQNQLGTLTYDLEWNNGTSFVYTLDSTRECRVLALEVGILRPNWLDGGNYLGQRYMDGFLCNVWEKEEFIWYYEDVVSKRPVFWVFYSAELGDCWRGWGSSALGMGTGSGSESNDNGWAGAGPGVVLKTLAVVGGAILLKRLTKSTTRWDHTRLVARSLSGEKYTKEQASRDPDNFFNLRWLSCPAAEMVDGSKILYFEKAFWRTPHKPFRQRFFMVKPCPNEMKCDVELSTYAIRDAEEYKNFCDRPKDQRPQPEEVIGDIAEHLTTIYLKRCQRGQRCLYEGSTPPDGFPNTWNGATYCTSELSVVKNNEIHSWDRGYDDDGNQVWGVKGAPYEFKPAPASSFVDMFPPLSFPTASFVLRE